MGTSVCGIAGPSQSVRLLCWREPDRLSEALSIKDTERLLELQGWVSSPWGCIPGHKAPISDPWGPLPEDGSSRDTGTSWQESYPHMVLTACSITHPSFGNTSFCQRDGWDSLQSSGCPHISLGISEPVGSFCNPKEDFPLAL